jgi:hypothetical protein
VTILFEFKILKSFHGFTELDTRLVKLLVNAFELPWPRR